jgi:hypothetical protein
MEHCWSHLQLFVILGLCVHLDFNGVNFEQLRALLLVVCTIFSLTRLVQLFQDLQLASERMLVRSTKINEPLDKVDTTLRFGRTLHG